MSRSPGPATASFFDRLGGGETRRAPQPRGVYGLATETLADLERLTLEPDRPLLALDADEVLLEFARPLQAFMATRGWRLDLSAYRIDGGVTSIADGRLAERGDVAKLIAAFFETETRRQPAAPGAVDAVAALATEAQIVVLTNVPFSRRDARAARLAEIGLPYPVVANTGGKGRALRWLWDRTGGAVAFVDDTDAQLLSAKDGAPGVRRARFISDDQLRAVAEPSRGAEAQFETWAEGVAVLRGLLGLAAAPRPSR